MKFIFALIIMLGFSESSLAGTCWISADKPNVSLEGQFFRVLDVTQSECKQSFRVEKRLAKQFCRNMELFGVYLETVRTTVTYASGSYKTLRSNLRSCVDGVVIPRQR